MQWCCSKLIAVMCADGKCQLCCVVQGCKAPRRYHVFGFNLGASSNEHSHSRNMLVPQRPVQRRVT